VGRWPSVGHDGEMLDAKRRQRAQDSMQNTFALGECRGDWNGTGNCGYSPEITKQELFVTSVLQTRELEIHRTSTECHYIFRTSANMFFL